MLILKKIFNYTFNYLETMKLLKILILFLIIMKKYQIKFFVVHGLNSTWRMDTIHNWSLISIDFPKVKFTNPNRIIVSPSYYLLFLCLQFKFIPCILHVMQVNTICLPKYYSFDRMHFQAKLIQLIEGKIMNVKYIDIR